MKIRNYVVSSLFLAVSLGVSSCSSLPSLSLSNFSQMMPSQLVPSQRLSSPSQRFSTAQLVPSKWLPSQLIPSQQKELPIITDAKIASVSQYGSSGYLQPRASANKSYQLSQPVKIPGRLSTKHNVPNNAERYYVVVGTYDTAEKAMDQFVRLSSIGLTKAAMETRVKGDRTLHMVRMGPFIYQDEIDHVKDRLRSDGFSNFTVVKN